MQSLFTLFVGVVLAVQASSRRNVYQDGQMMLQILTSRSTAESTHLAAALPSASSEEMSVEIESALISRIFLMCVVMFGGVAILWGINLKSGQPQSLRIAVLCLSWASTSVGMHVLNKALVDYLQAPALISAFQMALTVLVVGARSYSDLVGSPQVQLVKWLIVPMFFAGMLISAFYAYARISLTLLTLVRNLTPLMMLPLELVVMTPENRPGTSVGVVAGICIMLVGALIYSGANLTTISLVGVAFAFLNMVIAVSDRLIQRRLLTTECKDLSSGTCTILNNFWGVLPTLLLASFTGQFQEAVSPEKASRWTEPHVIVLLLLSGLVGTGISIFGIECQRAISATSFSVMQNVSKVAVVTAGIVFFSDPIGSAISVVGLALSLGGSFLYGYAQQQASHAKAVEKAAAAKDGK